MTKDVEVTKTKVGDRTIYSVDVGNMSAKEARKIINKYRAEQGQKPMADDMFWVRVGIVAVAVVVTLTLIVQLVSVING